MTAPTDTYTVASGQPIYGGRAAPAALSSYPIFADTLSNVPAPVDKTYGPFGPQFGASTYLNRPIQLELHGSGGQNAIGDTHNAASSNPTGDHYSVTVDGRMAYLDYTNFEFSLVGSDDGTANRIAKIRPVDQYGAFPGNGQKRESFFGGFSNIGSSNVMLITARRLDAMWKWALSTQGSKLDFTRATVAGGSMGADACFRYGIRRPQYFAAVYSDRGRWRYAAPGTKMMVPDWNSNIQYVDVASVPAIDAADGGGSYKDWCDGIAYVSNTANALPFIAWGMGTADTNYSMTDHAAALDALRARKAGHCFVWSAAGHETTTLPRLYASYPPGLFQIGKSYPYFFEHSLDKDPRVDAVGGINEGLTFDPATLIDTPAKWECRVKHISSACTVKVEPCNPVNFPKGVGAQLVNITAANTWITVTFTA